MSFGGPVFGQPGGGGFPQPGNPGVFGGFGTPGAGLPVPPGVFGGSVPPGSFPGPLPIPTPPVFGGGGFGVGPESPGSQEQHFGYFGPHGGGITTIPSFPTGGGGFPDHGPAIANIHQVLADHHNALQSLLAAIHSIANTPAKPSRPSHPLPLQ